MDTFKGLSPVRIVGAFRKVDKKKKINDIAFSRRRVSSSIEVEKGLVDLSNAGSD